MEEKQQIEERFIRLPELIKLVAFGRSTIWRKVQEGVFPKPIKVSSRVTVWRFSEIMNYINNAGVEV